MAYSEAEKKERAEWAAQFVTRKINNNTSEHPSVIKNIVYNLGCLTRGLPASVIAFHRHVKDGFLTEGFGETLNSFCNSRDRMDSIVRDYRWLNEHSLTGTYPMECLIADFIAMFDLYDNVKINKASKTLSFETKNISFKEDNVEVDCGPMIVTFHLNELPGRAYIIAPKKANFSSGNPGIFHPHVGAAGDMCEGDGSSVLTRTFREGRLLDAMDIINNILHTYNPGDPYVHIIDWYKLVCNRCETDIEAEDSVMCECCDRNRTFCGDCIIVCGACHQAMGSCCQNGTCAEDGCNVQLCSSCSREHRCRCSSWFCPEHLHSPDSNDRSQDRCGRCAPSSTERVYAPRGSREVAVPSQPAAPEAVTGVGVEPVPPESPLSAYIRQQADTRPAFRTTTWGTS